MFTKIALLKFFFVPLAALTFLAQVASACPNAVQHRQDDDDPPPPPDRDCRPDRSRLPRIIRPDRDTVWSVGDWRRVRWEERGRDADQNDGDGNGNDPNSKDSPDDRRRPRCKPLLVLYKRRDDDSRPFVLGANFDIDDGFLDVPVPNMRPDDDYRVVMQLGRLESKSERFTIRRGRQD